VLVFYYPRDTAVAFEKLLAQLHAEEVCMIFFLVNVPHRNRSAGSARG